MHTLTTGLITLDILVYFHPLFSYMIIIMISIDI